MYGRWTDLYGRLPRTEGTGVSRTADVLNSFASFRNVADAVGKRVR